MLSFLRGSRSRSQPVFIYDVVYGSSVSQRLYLTDAEQPISWNGNEYLAAQIQHSEISASGSLDKAAIEVRTDLASRLTEVFRTYPPDRTVTLIIREGDLNDPDEEFIAVWSGRILGFAIEGIESKFTCEPIGTAARRPGLRRNYQFSCPHVLYGNHCRAAKLPRTVNARVSSLDGSTLSLPTGWNGVFDPVKFQAGMAEWTNSQGGVVVRSILRVAQAGDGKASLLLAGLPTGLLPGATVALSVGCSRQMPDCKDLHDNINNFGGQPWIPLKNPIGNYNSFY